MIKTITAILLSTLLIHSSHNISQEIHATGDLKQGSTKVLDFTASWCEACQEMNNTTLSDPEVRSAIKLVKVDMSTNTAYGNRMSNRYGVYGLPTLVFINSAGGVCAKLVGVSSKEAVLSAANRC